MDARKPCASAYFVMFSLVVWSISVQAVDLFVGRLTVHRCVQVHYVPQVRAQGLEGGKRTVQLINRPFREATRVVIVILHLGVEGHFWVLVEVGIGRVVVVALNVSTQFQLDTVVAAEEIIG